ncbi:MAG: hypothetical protein ABUL44_03030 [Flavobacterium sp.]
MTISELHTKLLDSGIPDDKYYLHGLYGPTDDNEKIGMTIKKGKYAIEYEVYFRERGEKHSSKTFTNEQEACDYFFKRLTESWTFEQSLKTGL